MASVSHNIVTRLLNEREIVMKYLRSIGLVTLLTFSVVAVAQVVKFFKGGRTSFVSWDASTLNEDGSALTDLASYTVGIFDILEDITVPEPTPLYTTSIVVGTQSASLLTIMTDSALPVGTYVFAVRAVDEHGNESVWSEFVSIDIKIIRPNQVIGVQSNK